MRVQTTNRRLWGLLLLFVAANVWFALGTRGMRSAIEEMPPPPTERALRAMAFGDDEFLYRHLGRWLEFVGDGGGRVRPLRVYDYDRVVGWPQTLDRFDYGRSEYVQYLAAHYFGEVNIDPDRVRKIVEYLRAVGLSDPVHKWKWLVWCAHVAVKPLKDPQLIHALAKDLQSPELQDPSIPAWVRLMPVRLYHQVGDEAASREALAKASPADIAAFEDSVKELRRHLRAAVGGKNTAPEEEPPER
jgi:hypothetical protein